MGCYLRAQASVDLEAVRHNLQEIKKTLKTTTRVMAIVKANAYGHGAIKIGKNIEDLVDCFGVATVDEAVELRQSPVEKPILVLGYSGPGEYEKLLEYNISATIIDYKMALALNETAQARGKICKVHIKIDTGMERLGFPDKKASLEKIKKISRQKNIEIEGIFTHFWGSTMENLEPAKLQLKRFEEFIKLVEAESVDIGIKHISNSGGILNLPQAQLDMVRPGIMTYGIYPSKYVDKTKIKLRPAMEIKSHISFIKKIPPDTGIGYDNTFYTKKDSKIATITMGYGDGYPWLMSNKGRVIINNQYAPIVGSICMDQFMVDVTGIENLKQGDQVILMGVSGEKEITIEEISNLSKSFPYEILCNVNQRVPRIYIS